MNKVNITKEERMSYLQEYDELAEKNEELESQQEELKAAINALMEKNDFLNKALAELTERNFEMDQLMYRTSHDLRSPISSILGIINVLNINDDPKLLNDYIFHIKTKASQLDNTIQSLVELIKSSRERLTFEKINIEELIESIVLKLSNRENFDNLNIIINNISTDCDFYSNKFRVEIIIKAIISNAIQFQAQNKDDQNKLTIDIKINREKIIMKFWDNGTGIPPQIIDKVNGMFFRGSFQSKGAGMGLYITDKIVKVLEGEMVIESKEGEWTHVILKLPNRNPS